MFDIALSPTARRALSTELPESVATAIIEFITTALITNPYIVGKPLMGELSGVWSARRGSYRVLYRIDESNQTVFVVRIDHRRDAYRPR